MREMTIHEYTKARLEAAHERYPAGPSDYEQVLVEGLPMNLRRPRTEVGSPAGLASLFVGLGGGRKR